MQFTGGGVRLLIATDAAAEGLNLQARCRLVVNVELPWSPRVLEQRAGRVDRLGQARVVHVWQLLGRAGHEAMVVAALARRLEAIRADFGEGGPPSAAAASRPAIAATPMDAAAAAVSRALRDLRRLRTDRSPRAGGSTRAPRTRSIWIRARRRHPGLGRSVILIFTSPARGMADADQHVAVHIALSRWPTGSPSCWLAALAHAATPTALSAVRSSGPMAARLAWRERLLLEHATDAGATRRWQPSFFDRRAARIVEASRHDTDRLVALHDQRRRALTADPAPARLEPVCALLVR